MDEPATTRIREIMTSSGLDATGLAELIHVPAEKITASLDGDRRWSTYEVAAIAEHASTTVEWILRDPIVVHEHNADRTRENGWACWRCTGCSQLCHYLPAPPVPEVYAFCPCCTEAGRMPCLACGDPCEPAGHAKHIQAKHPACPACLVIEGSALGIGCTCATVP